MYFSFNKVNLITMSDSHESFSTKHSGQLQQYFTRIDDKKEWTKMSAEDAIGLNHSEISDDGKDKKEQPVQ
jgi:hypothetical protein